MFAVVGFGSHRFAFDNRYRAVHYFHELPMSKLCRDRLSIPSKIQQIENLEMYFQDQAIQSGLVLHLARRSYDNSTERRLVHRVAFLPDRGLPSVRFQSQ